MTGEEPQKPVRVLVIVSKRNPRWSESWTSTDETISIAVNTLKENGLINLENKDMKPRLLVKQKWHLRILFVFDLCNKDYDVKLGHLPEQNKLPVLVVHFTQNEIRSRAAELGIQEKVNRETAEAHNVNGEHGVPPYAVDHTTTIPVYLSLRDPSLLRSSAEAVRQYPPVSDKSTQSGHAKQEHT